MHYWGYYLSLVLGWIYVVFSPLFFLLLLNQNISLEVFVTIIGGFYLIMTALFIGMSIYAGSSNVLRIFGIDDWNEIKDKMAERKSKRKYG